MATVTVRWDISPRSPNDQNQRGCNLHGCDSGEILGHGVRGSGLMSQTQSPTLESVNRSGCLVTASMNGSNGE